MSELEGAEHFATAYYTHKTQENRDRLVFATEPVLRSIISKIRTPGDDLARPEELYQVGVIAVLQALDQYDPSTGVRFVTFAYPRIRGEIVDYLRRLDPLPRRRRVKVAHARYTFDRLAQQMGGEPTESDIATAMGVDVPAYRVIKSDTVRRQMDYLFDDRGEEEGLRLVDLMPDSTAVARFESMEWQDIRTYLDNLSMTLSERDRTIIELNYGEDLTLSEIGMLLGVSEARVSQLRKSILSKLARCVEPSLRTAA
ncbi:sigma-70 family RNA polymerase sigma factor [bacterium]|nr:sigma-70 family RNA polymerase sigma factor [bacterium]